MSIQSSVHPDYSSNTGNWGKYRSILTSGKQFLEKYLERFSIREDNAEFTRRKATSYVAAHAKSAIFDIRNSIYNRLIDINRIGGSDTYRLAVGENVDRQNNSMNAFMGRVVLTELLFLGKVGVYIDRPIIEPNASKADVVGKDPYLYCYQAENIRNWVKDKNGRLIKVLLKEFDYSLDELEMPIETVERFRLLEVTGAGGVQVTFYDKDGNPDGSATLELTEIPFVIFDLGISLLTDVADYQIAATNLASSDLGFCLKANYPFYTEQFDPRADSAANRVPEAKSVDNKSDTKQSVDKTVQVGMSQGRRYPIATERPGFINPSTEPLRASMDKQDIIKREIREMINTNIQNINPTRSSVESKKFEERGVEANLANIGLELERGENQISKIWHMYEGSQTPAIVKYPHNYSLRSDSERRAEAKELNELQSKINSKTYQIEIAKQMAVVTIGHKVDSNTMKTIINEIEAAKVLITDPEDIRSDHESGLVGSELASELRGYPSGEVEKAKKDHAERLARVAAAQGGEISASRGTAGALDSTQTKGEKTVSQNADTNPDAPTSKTRGDGK